MGRDVFSGPLSEARNALRSPYLGEWEKARTKMDLARGNSIKYCLQDHPEIPSHLVLIESAEELKKYLKVLQRKKA